MSSLSLSLSLCGDLVEFTVPPLDGLRCDELKDPKDTDLESLQNQMDELWNEHGAKGLEMKENYKLLEDYAGIQMVIEDGKPIAVCRNWKDEKGECRRFSRKPTAVRGIRRKYKRDKKQETSLKEQIIKNGTIKFKCRRCAKEYVFESSLNRHIREKHEPESES